MDETRATDSIERTDPERPKVMDTDNMAILLEGIPFQPILEGDENKEHWESVALPLVRKVFKDLQVPPLSAGTDTSSP